MRKLLLSLIMEQSSFYEWNSFDENCHYHCKNHDSQ